MCFTEVILNTRKNPEWFEKNIDALWDMLTGYKGHRIQRDRNKLQLRIASIRIIFLHDYKIISIF